MLLFVVVVVLLLLLPVAPAAASCRRLLLRLDVKRALAVRPKGGKGDAGATAVATVDRFGLVSAWIGPSILPSP